MIVTAPPGIKNITAQLEQLITVAMMSRITLSLKRTAVRDGDDDNDDELDDPTFPIPTIHTENLAGVENRTRWSTRSARPRAAFSAHRTSFFSLHPRASFERDLDVPGIPQHAVLSDRHAFELRSLKASTHLPI